MVLDFNERLEQKQKTAAMEASKKWFHETFGEESIETKKAIIAAIFNEDKEKLAELTEPIINRKVLKKTNEEMKRLGYL